MKQLALLILFFLLTSAPLFAQSDVSVNKIFAIADNSSNFNFSPTSEAYKQTKEWKTYKTLNITGWCALGVGLPMTYCGIYLLVRDIQLGDGDPWSGSIAVTAVGGTLVLSSIPLLIVANRYKKKAKMNNISLDLTNIITKDCLGFQVNTPAVKLTYSF